jgi:hypothetical protein
MRASAVEAGSEDIRVTTVQVADFPRSGTAGVVYNGV